MKTKILLTLLAAILCCSCGYGELYEKTDMAIKETIFSTGGLLDVGTKRYANDGYYQITPIGHLVVVKITDVVDDDEYETLCDRLAKHYKKNKVVNKVYINQGGTVVIDCR